MLRATAAALLALLAACGVDSLHGPSTTAYRYDYFELPSGAVHEAVLKIFERWRVGLRSDDGRLVRTRSFRDGESAWRMQVEIDHANGTTAVLVRMNLLEGGSVAEDVVDTDYEAIVRWQVGGDPDAFRLPEAPSHADRVKGELVDWLKRWRAGEASSRRPSGKDADPEHRARNRRELFLFTLKLLLSGA